MNDWREAFIAMSALLGEPPDSIGAIESAAELPLAAQLRDEDKTRRALALSHALGEIAIEIENLQIEISS